MDAAPSLATGLTAWGPTDVVPAPKPVDARHEARNEPRGDPAPAERSGSSAILPDTAPDGALVVLPTQYNEAVPAHVERAFDESIDLGVRRSGAVSRRPRVTSPCDGPCLEEVARATASNEMIRVVVERRNERDYTLRISLVTPQGRVLASRVSDCELCGITELSEAAENLAAAMATTFLELPRGAGYVVIESSPVGAEIFVDGEARGRTPARVAVSPGRHAVELRAPGHGAARRQLESASGVEQQLVLRLEPIGQRRSGLSRNVGRRFEIAGWTLMAAAAIPFGVGGWMLAVDGDPYGPSCTDERPRSDAGLCPRRYATLEGGIALISIGGAALVTGIAFVAWQRRSRSPSARSMRIEPRRGGLAVRF